MWSRRSIRWPILLAVGMIALVAILTVGWVLLAVFAASREDRYEALYWTLLPIGATFLALLVAGVVLYLVMSIKTINLTLRQSNFIDSVTHELKSPLASMKLALQTLGRHHLSPEELSDFYQYMLDDLERLDRLINRMLAAAQLESSARGGEAEDVDLDDLLGETAALVCGDYHVPPTVAELQCAPIRYHARRGDLELLFRNLIDNAVKYAGTPPQVCIAAERGPRGEIIVRIADNGRGIPRKLRRKVFGRFVRVGSELEREKPGTGLGLYIVRTVLGRLGGRIAVRDGEEGGGTLFEVRLPPSPATAAASSGDDA